MPRKKQIDEIDISIINILSTNASISNQSLSKQIGLAPMPTLNRVKKLRSLGYLGNSATEVDLQKFGYTLVTYQIIEIKNGFGRAFKSIISKLKNVTRLHQLSSMSYEGNSNEKYGVEMHSKNTNELRETMEGAFKDSQFIIGIDTLVINEETIKRPSITLDPEEDRIR